MTDSRCRCIFDAFVGEGELHVLLLCHLDHSPPIASFPIVSLVPTGCAWESTGVYVFKYVDKWP